jgi:crotonobetainyl-CoA:carnitine CoA-transferase CaiB-like acyl-CoA transferase
VAASSRNPLAGNYTTRDGKLITLMMLQFERYWPLFANAVGRREWRSDERFDSAGKRRKNFPAIVAEIAAEIRKRDHSEWEALLRPTPSASGPRPKSTGSCRRSPGYRQWLLDELR